MMHNNELSFLNWKSSSELASDNESYAFSDKICEQTVYKKEEISVPIIIFYKKGDDWVIGKKGNEDKIDHLLGLSYIHFLIEHTPQKFYPQTLYHLGKHVESNYVHSSSQIERDHTTTTGRSQQIVTLDGKRTQDIRDSIDYLKIKIDKGDFSDTEDYIYKQNQLDILQNYLKDRNRTFKYVDKDKNITTVYHAIKRALKKIHNNFPELQPFLNKSTITIKDSKWFYDPATEVKLILFPALPSS